MTENAVQPDLEELREHVTVITQLCRRHPEQLQDLLLDVPDAVGDLQRSLEELLAIVEARPESKQAEARLALQYTVARVLSEARTLEEAAAPILQTLCENLGWEVGELWSVDPRARVLHCVHLWASPSVEVSEFLKGSRKRMFAPGLGASGRVWPSDRPTWTADIAADESFPRAPAARRVGLHGAFYLPVPAYGEIRALIQVFSRRVRQKDEAEEESLTAIASQIGQFLERKHGEKRLRESEAQQERWRALAADLLLAEERERRSLAVDLHDGLSQTIALVRMKLAVLRRSTDAALSRSLDEIERLIDQANQSARSITFELSPPVLHDLGLEPAVQWLIENIRVRYGLEIVLEDDGQPKPADEKTRVILFRSIRELLINAAKHAGARRVHVRLEREEDRLNAAVEDDGVGMEPEAAAVKGTGLFSIRERLSHMGGSMHIESAPGRGTKVRLCAPLVNGNSKKAEVRA